MQKRLFLLLSLCCLTLALPATRPLRRIVSLPQSDGTSVSVFKVGNAFLSYYMTMDGVAVDYDAAGDLCYVRLAPDGTSLSVTGQIAHDAVQRTEQERRFVSELRAEKSRIRAAARRLSAAYQRPIASVGRDGINSYGQAATGSVKSIGSPVIPVIMVDFTDRAFQESSTEEKVSRLFNEAGYADERASGCVGSVKDYFEAQSQSLFRPTFKVVGKVSTMLGYAAYGKRAAGGASAGTRSLLREALDAAVEDLGVDFSEFCDESGSIPLVAIYYAGPGAHNAYEREADNYIHAHYQTVVMKVQGIDVRSCLLGNEIMQTYKDVAGSSYPEVTGSDTDGIGVFCHEFGHALGLPDFYYTGDDDNIYYSLLSMDYWSVMDYGQWYSDGYAPVGYNAYERAFMGWQHVEELTASEQPRELVPYHKADDGGNTTPTCYRLTNPENSREYFLLENRQPGTWYPEEMGHGLLITHVDYDAAEWGSNPHSPNNVPEHQRFTYVPADGEKEGVNSTVIVDGVSRNVQAPWSDCQADLFPGRHGVKEFSAETSPDWYTYYTATPPTNGFYNIAEAGGIVRFVYGERPDDGPINPYDINRDNVVDVSDITALVGVLLEGGTAPAEYDLNNDGVVDIGDVTTLVARVLRE
ncbi:MAG: M6 family metalloprotease domain-containing protein [Alloprevotella sp.]|nr:M6 family metalloprotease domain-containing protein [Alloprevotella sp.]